MGKILRHIRRFFGDETGQAMVEYVLIVVCVAIGSYFVMAVLSDLLLRYYNEIAAHVCLPIP